jgi:hypothetical protein
MRYDRKERGTAVMEFVLVMPLAVIAILLLIGLGHTIMVKQQSLVAARYAAFYHRSREEAPSLGEVRSEVVRRIPTQQETWNVSGAGESAADAGIKSGDLGPIAGAVDAVLNGLGGDGVISYTTGRIPRRGFLPSLHSFNNVGAHYALANRTWNCDERGDYFSLLSGQLGIPKINLPLTLSCCETYQPTR